MHARMPIALGRFAPILHPMSSLSDQPLGALAINPAERPHLSPMPGATDEHRRQGRKLAAIHRGHLWDLARIAKVLARIKAGETPPDELRDIVLASDMTQNYRSFGSLCGQECRVLGFHHDAEEHHMFPELEAVGQNALTRVVARLRAEHAIVHELLLRLERAAMTLIYEPTDANFALAEATFERLLDVVRSHFGYEETELEEAIGLYLDAI